MEDLTRRNNPQSQICEFNCLLKVMWKQYTNKYLTPIYMVFLMINDVFNSADYLIFRINQIIMQQKNEIRCHRHPQHPVNLFINIKPDKSGERFNCEQCFEDSMNSGSNYKDFVRASELTLTHGLRPILKSEHYKDNLYQRNLAIYDEIFENDMNQLINEVKSKWCEQLEQLRNCLKPQIEIHTNLLEKFKEYQESWLKIVGYTDFMKEYNQVQQMIEKNSQSDEWKHLEVSLEAMLKQINMKQNDEIKVMSDSLGQQLQQLVNSKEQQWLQLFEDLESSNRKLQISIMKSLGLKNFINSSLCPISFATKINKKLNNKIKDSQLLYKLGIDAKTFAAVWQKINGKAHTLMFIELDTNQIIGAYTPAVWSSQVTKYIADNTLQSFLFSITKSEIYPLYQNPQNAIHSNSQCLPRFGNGGTELCLEANFTAYSSTLGNTYKTSDYNIVDNTTHLLNAKLANIKQFEIYQLSFQ